MTVAQKVLFFYGILLIMETIDKIQILFKNVSTIFKQVLMIKYQ